MAADPTVVAIPFYFGSMEAERRYLRRRAEQIGPSAADYTKEDTTASLTMGVASLVVPLASHLLVQHVVPGKGRYGRLLVGTAAGAAAVTTIADRVAGPEPEGADVLPGRGRELRRWARKVRRVAGPGGGRHRGAGRHIVAVEPHQPAPDVGEGPAPRPGRRARGLGGRHRRMGLHLLLEPPDDARGPGHVGDPRRPPLQRALQPLDRAAAAGGRRPRRVGSLRPAGAGGDPPGAHQPGAGHQPPLPVLDPHRRDPVDRPRRRRC